MKRVTHRRVPGDQQDQNAAMLRIASKVARLGGWTLELPQRTLSWSDENCTIHEVPAGYRPTFEEGLGLYAPEHRAEVLRHVQACERDGTPYDIELPKLTAKGRRIWVRSIGEAVHDAQGRIIRLQGAFQDITERKRADEVLKRKDALLRIAGRVARIGGWAISIPGQQIDCSDEVVDMLGFARGATPTLEQALELYLRSGREKVVAAVIACAREGTPFDLETEVLTARDEKIWVRIAAHAQRGADGAINSVHGAFQDVSDRKRAEGALRANEARFRTVVQSSWDVFQLVEPGGRITYESPSVTRVLGYLPQELVGRHVLEFVHPRRGSRAGHRFSAATGGVAFARWSCGCATRTGHGAGWSPTKSI